MAQDNSTTPVLHFIEKARAAQQKYEQLHDVQLSFDVDAINPDWRVEVVNDENSCSSSAGDDSASSTPSLPKPQSDL